MSSRAFRAALLVAGLGVTAGFGAGVRPAAAAERGLVDRLDRIGVDVDDTSARVQRLAREYEQRRGLIGGEEALQRYEDAVYAFLVGEYERAALTFFTLVESEALTTKALHHDSEWYLAECLFEMGNWASAVRAFDVILDAGPAHPYFDDAVRRKLELLGILKDSAGFTALYERFILSRKVQETDAIKYTVARSFYRQGQVSRAKAMFSDLAPGSSHAARARYFLGTLLAAEGELDAATREFLAVEAMAGEEADSIRELTWLALGRLAYEKGDFSAAATWYQRLPPDSPHFADRQYEQVWALIKQESWSAALEEIDTFLLAFPDHRYTMRMKVLRGHLHMKSAGYERALAAYEQVVTDYTPLQQRIKSMEESREDPAVFFERIVDSGGTGPTPGDLPRFAVEMLLEQADVARVVESSRSLSKQEGDIELSRNHIAEVGGVLRSPGVQSIGTFDRGRAALTRVRDDSLILRSRLLEAEIDALASVSSDTRAKVRAAEAEVEALLVRAQELQGEQSTRVSRGQVYEDQVRAVQSYAAGINREAEELRAETVAVRRLLEERKGGLSADTLKSVEVALGDASAKVEAAAPALDRLVSEGTRRAVLSTVPAAPEDRSDAGRAGLVQAFEDLHRRLRDLRPATADSAVAATLSRVDELWMRVSEAESGAVRVRGALDRAEEAEVAVLNRLLNTEEAAVAALSGRIDGVRLSALDLAARVTRVGFARLDAQVYESIMRADRGIVDVYWVRKSEVLDERERLAEERAVRTAELEARFSLIRQKLEE